MDPTVVSKLSILAGLVRSAKFVSYFHAASFCIMLYDVLITLDEEVAAIWSGRLSWMKSFYLFVRYSTVIEVGVVLWELVAPGDSFKACKIGFDINSWLFVVGLAVGEFVMSMRTWAVWKRDKKVAITLAVLWPSCWISGFTITGLWAKSVRFDPSPMAQFRGCFPTNANQLLFAAWLILLIYDTINLVLMCIPAYYSFRLGGGSQFVRTIYTDGIVYYAYLFALSLANIIVVIALPKDMQLLLSMMERVLHAVFTCRMVLHIHATSCKGDPTDDGTIPTYRPGDSTVLRSHGCHSLARSRAASTVFEPVVEPTPLYHPKTSQSALLPPGMKIVFAK